MKFSLNSLITDSLPGKDRYKIYVLPAILVAGFIPVRGLLVLLLNNKQFTSTVYSATLLLAFGLGFAAMKLSLNPTRLNLPRQLSQLLLVNLFFNILWLIPVIFVNPSADFLLTPVYLGILPFLVFPLRLINTTTMVKVIAFITVVIALGVLWDFVELNIIFSRYDIAIARQELLRPAEFENIGRNVDLVRPNGITGSRPHDSANLLAMFFAFWVAKYFFVKNKNKIFVIFLILLSGVGLLSTQVSSNIIAAFFVLAFLLPYGFFKYSRNIPYLGISVVTIVLVIFFVRNPVLFDALRGGFDRAGSEGDWEGMFSFTSGSMKGVLLTTLIGHAGSFKLFHAGEITEFAVMKLLFEQGIFQFIVMMTFLTYPLFLLFRNKAKLDPLILPFLGAFGVGIVSLWHYGSLFRITNEVVFLAFFAHTIVIIKQGQIKEAAAHV